MLLLSLLLLPVLGWLRKKLAVEVAVRRHWSVGHGNHVRSPACVAWQRKTS